MDPDDALLDAARRARGVAYAPYSGYAVGAAVRSPDGRVWTGCNVENLSFGGTICAERTATVKMVSEGTREIEAVAVATRDGGTPCGLCLQVLAEFAPDPDAVRVVTESEAGERRTFTLRELMPYGFRGKVGMGDGG